MSYLPVGRKSIKIPLNISNASVHVFTDFFRSIKTIEDNLRKFSDFWATARKANMPRSFSIRRNTRRHPNASDTRGKGLRSFNWTKVRLLRWSARLVRLLWNVNFNCLSSTRSGIQVWETEISNTREYAWWSSRRDTVWFSLPAVHVTWSKIYFTVSVWKAVHDHLNQHFQTFKYHFSIITFQIQHCCRVNFRKISHKLCSGQLLTKLFSDLQWLINLFPWSILNCREQFCACDRN